MTFAKIERRELRHSWRGLLAAPHYVCTCSWPVAFFAARDTSMLSTVESLMPCPFERHTFALKFVLGTFTDSMAEMAAPTTATTVPSPPSMHAYDG